MAIKPEITVTLFGRKKKSETPIVEEPTVDYVAIAEEAAARLGKKLVIGGVVLIASYALAATIGSITISAVDHYLDKK